jgi:hypothetical protein
MTSKNDDTATAAGMIAAALAIMALVAFFILAFLAFVLTILCLCAWNSPLRLGKFTLEPVEARGFVMRGVFGAFLLPVFFAFLDIVFGVGINWDLLSSMVIAGYVGGSIGLEILFAEEAQANGAGQQIQTIEHVPAPPTPKVLPPAKPAPFRFVSWDDEEEQK